MIKSCNTSRDVEFKTNSGYTRRLCLKKNKKQNICVHMNICIHTWGSKNSWNHRHLIMNACILVIWRAQQQNRKTPKHFKSLALSTAITNVAWQCSSRIRKTQEKLNMSSHEQFKLFYLDITKVNINCL